MGTTRKAAQKSNGQEYHNHFDPHMADQADRGCQQEYCEKLQNSDQAVRNDGNVFRRFPQRFAHRLSHFFSQTFHIRSVIQPLATALAQRSGDELSFSK
jgi:hypothetical protein